MKIIAVVSAQPLVRVGLRTCLGEAGIEAEVHEMTSYHALKCSHQPYDLALLDSRLGDTPHLMGLKPYAKKIALLVDVPAAYPAALVIYHDCAGIIHLSDTRECIQESLSKMLQGFTSISPQVAIEDIPALHGLPSESVTLIRHIATDLDLAAAPPERERDEETFREQRLALSRHLGLTTPRDFARFALTAGMLTLTEFIGRRRPHQLHDDL